MDRAASWLRRGKRYVRRRCQYERGHFKVAIIGGGPAGIGAAVGLGQAWCWTDRFDRASWRGWWYTNGLPKKTGWSADVRRVDSWSVVFGEELAGRLTKRLAQTSTTIRLNTQVTKIYPAEKRLTLLGPDGFEDIVADAVVLAAGAREQTPAEKGWLAGSRTARVGFTRHVTGWLDRHGLLPARKPIVVGSDLIAYSAAAKLCALGSDEPVMIDRRRSPEASFFERLFFRRWTRPDWSGGSPLSR
ncbi:MAG: hypothetical protein CM1200mP29_11040 [Verrucomicrobiota bacterium]|nr:MAG: hypothetical protein CM1200mP29_11040 [Verrucomicrobiota bacterium]